MSMHVRSLVYKVEARAFWSLKLNNFSFLLVYDLVSIILCIKSVYNDQTSLDNCL